MKNKKESKKYNIEYFKKRGIWVAIIIVMLAIPFVISYFSFIPLEGNLDAWIGFWGSMFGSMLAILGSVYLLQKQIADSKESLQKQISNDNKNIQEQRKEETFYSLLDLFLREQERIRASDSDTFKLLCLKIKSSYSTPSFWDIYKKTPEGKKLVEQRIYPYEYFDLHQHEMQFFDKVQEAIAEDSIAKEHSKLGNYFRLFHRVLKYINDNFEKDIKREHLGTLRAVLPEFELLSIFYNAFFTHRGKSMKKQFESTNFFGDAMDFINVDKENDHIFFQTQYLSKPELIMEKMKECFSSEEQEKYRQSRE